MTEPGHWAKFSDAERDCERFAHTATDRREMYTAAARLLSLSQRFYLPDAVNVLEGKAFDASIKPLLRLPYEVVALLSECPIVDSPEPDQQKTWKITVAIDPFGEVNRKMALIDPDAQPDGSFALMSVTRFGGRWVLLPMFCCVMFRPDCGIDIVVDSASLGIKRAIESASGRTAESEFIPDITSITNLCAILNLHNTRSVPVPVPVGMSKKRRLLRKRPLYEYHVLEVDGERWDSPHVSESGGAGVRSHLRRGHIRRLDNDRCTWVRATYVRGSVPGFVDKDYAVKTEAA